jgi:RHS repeat-associated protein
MFLREPNYFGTVKNSAFGESFAPGTTSTVDNRFTYGGREQNKNNQAMYYRYRTYNAGLGRWEERDPIDYDGGINLYEYARLNALVYLVPYGKWSSSDHKTLTVKSVEYIWVTLGLDPGTQCQKYVIKTLQDANVEQDSGQAFKENKRHYNRDIDLNNAGVAKANQDYKDYCAEEVKKFDQAITKLTEYSEDTPCEGERRSNCREALEALGRVSHSWEDYYAHAVLLSGAPGPAWSANPSIFGSPDDLNPQLKPSSWGGLLNRGEHGPANVVTDPNEPGDRDSTATVNGGEIRRQDARAFVSQKYLHALGEWMPKCGCCCPPPPEKQKGK